MKKIVSFFGERSELFTDLNNRAAEYAASLELSYRWAPQLSFDRENVIRELQNADAGIIDIEPYGEPIFSRLADGAKLLVRFGVGYDKVDLKAASRAGIAVARTTAANTTAVAEMALTLMLNCRRKFTLAPDPHQERHMGQGCGQRGHRRHSGHPGLRQYRPQAPAAAQRL
jgi:lactate dehydrogenase-like 2-hydroxyacid dehydrogenase